LRDLEKNTGGKEEEKDEERSKIKDKRELPALRVTPPQGIRRRLPFGHPQAVPSATALAPECAIERHHFRISTASQALYIYSYQQLTTIHTHTTRAIYIQYIGHAIMTRVP
jgi:hypothetical protein